MPRVGDPAPEVALVDQEGAPVTLAGLRGTPVLLVFVPFAFSPVCTGELAALRDHGGFLADAGVTVLGVSCDAMPALRAWREQEGLGFDLLSDFWPHGAAARAFGVLDEVRGRALRGSFLVDAAGVLRWSVVNPAGRPRDLAGYRRAVELLVGPAGLEPTTSAV